MKTDIDLNKAIDNYCSVCGKKKKKYIGFIGTTPAVFYKRICNCIVGEYTHEKTFLSDKASFDKLQVPFWRLMGAKPKPHEKVLEKWLKSKNMTYGDYRRYRDHHMKANNPSALTRFNQHINKYGRFKNEPDISFKKTG